VKEYTVPEAAEACKLSAGMLYRAIADGQLRATELPGRTRRDRFRISEEDLIAYKRWRVKKLGDYYPELDELG
jgi:excisionase family DNA binding protein